MINMLSSPRDKSFRSVTDKRRGQEKKKKKMGEGQQQQHHHHHHHSDGGTGRKDFETGREETHNDDGIGLPCRSLFFCLLFFSDLPSTTD